MEVINVVFEIIGTIAFAVSGALVAIGKKMDILGVVTMGTVTAVGGGMLRDICLGITPPNAFVHPLYTITAILVSLIVFYPGIRKKITSKSRVLDLILLIMDTVGLAVFSMVGIHIAFENGSNGFTAIMVGIFTGVGGGVIRDVLSDTTPFIFMKKFYCTAVIIGTVFAVNIMPLAGEKISIMSGAAIIMILRFLAARYKWQLPRA